MSVGLESALKSALVVKCQVTEAHDPRDALAAIRSRDASSLLSMSQFAQQNKTDTQRIRLGVENC